jgi:DNA-binding response OmpR family regulator
MARVLLVEDDADLRAELADALSLFDHEVIEAEHGLHGLRLMETAPVDIVVADHRMPQMTGLEMIGKMRERPEWACIPVIMVSAVSPVLPEAADRRPAVFMSKPPDIEVLNETIAGLLAGDPVPEH